jgi:N-acyl homoserine lactone hydrolase
MPEVELILTGFNVHTDQGRMGYCTVGLIRGEKTILVDTGHHGRRQLLLQTLAERGISPDDIDMVVLTHVHWNHCQNIDLFKNAQVAVHKDELEYAKNPAPNDWATAGYITSILQGHEVLEVVEGQELAEGVRVLGTPGHSKGHISVTVETLEGVIALTGDALTAASCIALGKPLLVFWNEEQAAKSVQKILASATIFYPGHDRPFRIDAQGGVEYLGGAKDLRIFQGLGFGNGEVSVTISPEPPRNTVVAG